MAGIYGKVTEHPEYPELDERRFTVEIRPHRFERRPDDAWGYRPQYECEICPFRELHAVHGDQT
jgi:hypothetical protein